MKDPFKDAHGVISGDNIHGYREAKRSMAGVVEARPGIIESCNIDPLHKDEEDNDSSIKGTIHATAANVTSSMTDSFNAATGMATGATKMAYGKAAGDEATLQQGRREWSGINK